MRYSKRYIFFTVVLFLMILAKFNHSTRELVDVQPFRGARLVEQDWDPLIAASVNDGVITLNIGSRSYTSINTGLYMDDRLQLMVPVSILRDSLNCSAHIYRERKLVVQKRDLSISFVLDQPTCLVNDTEVELISPMTKDENGFYVGMKDLADLLGYDWWFIYWDCRNNGYCLWKLII